MAKTRLQLANRALEKLLVVGAGQSPNAEDTEKADSVIDSMSETLSAQTIYTIADLSDINEAAFEWLAVYLGYMIAEDFGQEPKEAKRMLAEYMLRRIAGGRPTYETLRAEYF